VASAEKLHRQLEAVEGSALLKTKKAAAELSSVPDRKQF